LLGAFPYLLARPVAAGPDGSLHHSSHLKTKFSNKTADIQDDNGDGLPALTMAGHINWDSEKSVESILSMVQDNLETALQTSMAKLMDSKDKHGKEETVTSACAPKFIRNVSVVMGRGFYTYCPGPPAPFLRVEYYDPKVRWKIKLYLERGLELPHMYHPDPQQYDAVGMVPTLDSSQLGLDPLPFHCYEAHIPYTSEFAAVAYRTRHTIVV